MKAGIYKTSFQNNDYGVHYVTDRETAIQYIERLKRLKHELLSIDSETEPLPGYENRERASLSPHLSRVRLFQIFTGRNAIVFDCKLIGDTKLFTAFLEQGRFVGHNTVFDLQYLIKYFGVTKGNFGCSYLASKLLFHAIFPTDQGLSVSLKSLVQSILGVDLQKGLAVSDFTLEDLSFEQIEYSALDVIATYFLAEQLASKIAKYRLGRVYNLYKDAQLPIAKMQLNGIKLDAERHIKLTDTWREELYKAKQEVLKLTGLTYLTSTTLGDWLEKTLPKDVLAIWPRTESGKLQTDSNAFVEFSYLDIVAPFAHYQKMQKLSTSFGTTLIEQINPETGRIHAQFRLAGARTGRMSCSDPNLQQLPRDKEVRSNFIPEEGNCFVCADYSQIEIRVGAELSRDSAMLNAYKNGIDLHALTASIITKKDINNVTKDDRQKAKAFNFGLMFGLGAKNFSHYAKKAYKADVSQEEAEAGVQAFRDTYKGYRDWQLKQAEIGALDGFVTDPTGKRRCLDRENCYGSSMNTPVQGGASACMLYALVGLDKLLTKLVPTAKLINSVHDELLVECACKDVALVKECVEQAMREGFLKVFPSGVTRGISECKHGASWAAAK